MENGRGAIFSPSDGDVIVDVRRVRPKLGVRMAAAAAVIGLVWSGSAGAFPGPIPTFAEQVKRSKLIVLVRTGATRELKNTGWGFATHATRMTVLKILRGPADTPSEIEVGTERRGGAQYGDMFEPGRAELLFLYWSEGDETYHVELRVDGEYLVPGDAAVAEYARRTTELIEILAIDEHVKRSAALTEFYVTSVIHPATRFDGLEGLRRSAEGDEPERPRRLSADQLRRLADTVVRERPPTFIARELIWIVDEFPHAEIDRFLVECVERHAEPGWEDVVDAAVGALPKRLKFGVPPELQTRLDEYFSDNWWAETIDYVPGKKVLEDIRRSYLMAEFLALLERAKVK
jgi:hypothetical protein